MLKPITGVYAALTTARKTTGALDVLAIQKSISFLQEKGINGFAINGATGEYCNNSIVEVAQIVKIAKAEFGNNPNIILGIGATSLQQSLLLGQLAIEAGAKAVLLPAPHFFKYSQIDLQAFCQQISQNLPIPILLYNLPQFTTGYQLHTVMNLMDKMPNIVGIKDSSGSLDILQAISNSNSNACRIVGNDSVLGQALSQNICDGVISGVASAMPELILGIYNLKTKTDSSEFETLSKKLAEFIEKINVLPTPWG